MFVDILVYDVNSDLNKKSTAFEGKPVIKFCIAHLLFDPGKAWYTLIFSKLYVWGNDNTLSGKKKNRSPKLYSMQ